MYSESLTFVLFVAILLQRFEATILYAPELLKNQEMGYKMNGE
jgi:hypothetical protein